MKSKSFAECVGSFLKAPFKEGGTELDGYDCIGLVGRIAQARGMIFPEEFGMWNKENYHELYGKDPQEANETMIAFFDSFAERVNVDRIVAGDLIIVEQSEGVMFPAIYTGAGNAVTSFIKNGVSIFHLDEANKTKLAWRLTQCQE